MDYNSCIQKIMAEAKCKQEVAEKAYKEAQGNVDLAILIAKRQPNELYVGGKSGLMVESNIPKPHKIMTLYKNGLMIEDKFYDFSKRENRKIKEMLEKKEFDRELLGEDAEYIEVIFHDKSNEEYKLPETHFKGEGVCISKCKDMKVECPDILQVDEEADVIFKVLIGSKRVTVKINSKRKIEDFKNYMKKYVNEDYELYNNNILIDNNEQVDLYKNCLLKAKVK